MEAPARPGPDRGREAALASLLGPARALAERVFPTSRLMLEAAPGGFPACLLAAAAPRRALVLVDDADALASAVQDLRALAPETVEVAPLPGPLPFEGATLPLRWSDSVQRLKVFDALAQGRDLWVVATVEAALTPAPEVEAFRAASLRLVRGAELDREGFLEALVELGYRRQETVTIPGEFAARGGIVDVFPPASDRPLRLDFLGDELESLRRFSPATQRSVEELPEAQVGPAWELPSRSLLRKAADGGVLPEAVEEKARELLAGELVDGVEEVLEHLDGWNSPPLAHLSERAPLVSFLTGLEASRIRARAAGPRGPGDPFEALLEGAGARPLWDLGGAGVLDVKPSVDLGVRAAPAYAGNLRGFLEDVRAWCAAGEEVGLALGEAGRLDRVRELLEDEGVEVSVGKGSAFAPGRVALFPVDLARGYRLPGRGLHLLAAADIWADRALKSAPRDQTERGARFSDFTEIEEGCMVVHVDHGIGRFVGVRPMLVDGMRQDFLEIEYAKGDKLFVPSSQLDRVQRFVGVEGGHAPKVNRLNSTRWAQARGKVRADVEKVAKELLELYARREAAQGHAFGPDTVWQRELEESFPYPDTRDQARASEDVKRDMERVRPMDRLICGDVGFGKTEVAVRAAFKAVQDSCQVAILCPTTVLAQQHYQTFAERLADFPVRLGVVSRLRDPAEVRRTLAKVRRGEIDVLIGTHRLLSRDVAFKRLGLLVIDEEQRFGVKHKERIKELKTSVDVLTLTATPIPRTLNLALSGARDISTIVTPPRGRLPVRTFVQGADEALVRGAVEKEVARGGQVFYVHNRIETLGKVVDWLRRLVPEARIRGGHAQMERQALESLMLDFYQAEFDVLVSTTIIENGLDIPNVNTILIDRADRLGLGQLYQLRGRVGRTTRQAYAFLLYPPDSEVSEDAFKRLKTLEEFTELGSGFRVAMRDLELRGAGSILGVEQSGFVNIVGFELYTRLLREAVATLGGKPEDAPVEPAVLELPVQAYLPEDYIASDEERLQAYRSLAELVDEDELGEYRRELEDRYGPIPSALDGLFEMVRLKIRATRQGIASLKQRGTQLEVRMREGRALPEAVVNRLMRRHGRRTRFHPNGFDLSGAGWPRERLVDITEELLAGLEETSAGPGELSAGA